MLVLLSGVPAPFAWFQLNLTSANTSIYHRRQGDEATLSHERSFSERSEKELPIIHLNNKRSDLCNTHFPREFIMRPQRSLSSH